MSLVKLLGFETLACGCLVGRYREIGTGHSLTYVEEKGAHCPVHGHRRNHAIAADPQPSSSVTHFARKAS